MEGIGGIDPAFFNTSVGGSAGLDPTFLNPSVGETAGLDPAFFNSLDLLLFSGVPSFVLSPAVFFEELKK